MSRSNVIAPYMSEVTMPRVHDLFKLNTAVTIIAGLATSAACEEERDDAAFRPDAARDASGSLDGEADADAEGDADASDVAGDSSRPLSCSSFPPFPGTTCTGMGVCDNASCGPWGWTGKVECKDGRVVGSAR